MASGLDLSNKINWTGGTQSKFEKLFSGKTINMTKEEQLSQLRSISSGHTTYSAATPYTERINNYSNNAPNMANLVEAMNNKQKSVSAKPERISQNPNNPKKRLERTKVSHSGVSNNSTYSVEKVLQKLSLTQNNDGKFISGMVDQSFPNGYENGFDDNVFSIAIQSDGKILVGGNFVYYYYDTDSYYAPYLIRLNPDGTVDTDFSTDNLNGGVYSIAIQPDGKIILGGYFNSYDGENYNSIIRINSDGSPDNTFAIGNGFNNDVYDIKLQSDGKILVGGDFTQYNGYTAAYLIRLRANGSVDSSFLIGDNLVQFNGYVNAIKIQSDGKILVGGDFTSFNDSPTNYIVRLNTDGTRDTSFVIGNGFSYTVNAIDIQSDGKIIVGGDFGDSGNYDNNPCNFIVRLNTDGSLDSTFGFGVNGNVTSILVQPDDKILVGGNIGSFYPYYNNYTNYAADELVRYNADTSIDWGFYHSEMLNGSVNCIALDSNNNILIGGDFNDSAYNSEYVLRHFGKLYNTIPKYKYVYTVNVRCAFNDYYISVGSNTLLTLDDEYIYVSARSLSSPTEVIVGELNLQEALPEIYPYAEPDYVLENLYSNCADANNDNYNFATVVSLLNSGITQYFLVNKLYKEGDIFFINQLLEGEDESIRTCFQIVTLDTNYFGTQPYKPIAYAPYESCEECVRANGVIYNYYNWDVEFDGSFIGYQYLNPDLYPAVILPNTPTNANFVYESPVFTNINQYNNIPEYRSLISFTDPVDSIPPTTIPLLETVKGDGQFDYSFNSEFIDNPNGGFNDTVYTTKLQSDGKILVGGLFDQYNSLDVSIGVCRLNSDGTIDNSFNANLSNSEVYSIETLSNGDILIGGYFEGAQGYESYCLVKVDKYGNLDTNFSNNIMSSGLITGGFNGTVSTIKSKSDGKILVGGNFNTFNDYEVDGFVQLNADGTLDVDFYYTKVFFEGQVYKITLQSDGKILVGGYFGLLYDQKTDDVYSVSNLTRLNEDGSLDFTFNTYGTIATWSDNTPFSGITAQYLRWTITKTKDISEVTQAAELTLLLNGSYVNYNGLVSATNPDGDNPVGEGPENLVDDNTATKWTDLSFSANGQSVIFIDNDSPITFNGYVYNTANDFPDRDPISWTLEASNDNINWFTISEVVDTTITNDRNTNTDIYPINVTIDDTGGSIYFDGGSFVSANTDTAVWNLSDNDFTFEWFQYFTGDVTVKPTVFSYLDTYLSVYFNVLGEIEIYVNGDTFTYTLNSSIENSWHHFALTREFVDPNYEWRIFQNGELIDTFEKSISYGQGEPLLIGAPSNYLIDNNNQNKFTGYITNFRVNNDCAIYTSNFDVPTAPLEPNYPSLGCNTVLCLLAMNQNSLILDSSDDSIPTVNSGQPKPGLNDYVGTIEIDSNNKILVGGGFDEYNYDFVGYGLIRLNLDGSHDQSLNIGDGFSENVNIIKIMSDGNILVGGWFTDYDGSPAPYIAKLTPDGSIDPKFLPTLMFDGVSYGVFDLSIQSDGKTILCGPFTYCYNEQVNGICRLYTANQYQLHYFDACNNSNYSLVYSPFSSTTIYSLIKGNVDTDPVVCGDIGDVVSGYTFTDGSMYFSNDDCVKVDLDSDFQLHSGDFTIEWFQQRNNGGGSSPRIFSIGTYDNPVVTIAVSFEGDDFTLWLNDYSYNFFQQYDLNRWCHFAISKQNNIIRVFRNGIQIGFDVISMIELFNEDNAGLSIGNEWNINNNAQYQGYITNFRWVKGYSLYTSNFDVPREPLNDVTGTKLLLLTESEANLLFDSSGAEKSPYQAGDGPVDFNVETPFYETFTGYYSDADVTYDSCNSCTNTTVYNSILLVRDGVNAPYINRVTISPENINRIQTYGPIFVDSMGGMRGIEVYELLGYSL